MKIKDSGRTYIFLFVVFLLIFLVGALWIMLSSETPRETSTQEREREKQRVNILTKHIEYIQYPGTQLCFAVYIQRSNSLFERVPCDKIPKDLLLTKTAH